MTQDEIDEIKYGPKSSEQRSTAELRAEHDRYHETGMCYGDSHAALVDGIERAERRETAPSEKDDESLELPGTIRLAIWFHETYEELAPQYGYATRPESRIFNAASPNGKLMLAVCRKLRERYAASARAEHCQGCGQPLTQVCTRCIGGRC